MRKVQGEPPIYSLFQIGKQIHSMNRRSESQLGLSLVQWYLLSRLVHMPASSPLALAAAVNVHPSTLTQTMKRLEKKRLIFVSSDPKDSRKKVVSITRAGKDTLDLATAKIDEWSSHLSLLGNDLERLRKCLSAQI